MPTDPYWSTTKIDYNSTGEPSYLGKHKTVNAQQDDAGWYIWKYALDASGNITMAGPKIGAWSNRTSLL